MGRKPTRKPILPVWAYVLMNVIVIAFLTAVYFLALQVAEKGKFISVGLFPVLLTCGVCFAFATLFDAFYEHFRRRDAERRPEKEAAPAIPPDRSLTKHLDP